ncbi:MAG: porin [Burkholderiales bacterium]|nr:porin [Burkholderiales bacterium]
MKKTLIALAVLAASTASMAQVTLYGVADAAIGSSDKTAAASGSVYGLANTQTQSLFNSNFNNGNSRWGMKGNEDLGGGMRAGFLVEGNIDLGDGSKAAGLSFTRQSYATLGGSFGELKVGRQYNPSLWVAAVYDLVGLANYSVAVQQFSAFTTGGFRDNGMISYTSPKLGGGLTLSLGTVLQGNAQFGTAADPKGKYDVNAIYAAGPLGAGFSYSKVDNGAENTQLVGNYNFGSFIVAGSWNSVKDGSGNTSRQGYTLGATLPVGPWAFTADIATVQSGSALLAGNSSDTNFLLEAKYNLSKQTFIYGAYVNDGKGINAQDNSAYSLGLRKNF